MKELIAVYGSLRKGAYNFKQIIAPLNPGIKAEVSQHITKYAMISLGSFPAVVYTGKESDTILVDLFRVNQHTKAIIDRMEVEFGYHSEIVFISALDHYASLYVFNLFDHSEMALKKLYNQYPKVTHGDWLKYQQEIE